MARLSERVVFPLPPCVRIGPYVHDYGHVTTASHLPGRAHMVTARLA